MPFDPILPTRYLDFDALKEHKILKRRADNFTYNLLFDLSHLVDTYLPAFALFDCHNKGRNFVLESKARAHNATVVAARHAEASAPRASVSYHVDYYPPGYRSITKLGQKPKLGGVRVLTDITFMPTYFHLLVFTLFHCITHA